MRPRVLLRYGWQGAAALYAASRGSAATPAGASAEQSPDDLVDRALATGDEHSIKFTEACLREHPGSTRPIDLRQWRGALGDNARVGDWIAFFDHQLKEGPWSGVLGEWVPRLAPGVIAAAFHGVIRTAHAVRSLGVQETAARRRELAEGLGYWAATYHVLPESP
ncbi:MAG: hypothetical protein DMF79_18700, partial [Acidobacteria bacterium]